MNDLLEKISSYNIFNYLFPGAVFGVLAERLQVIEFGNSDVITRLILYYFIGLCISRFGSVILEPILKYTKFVRYANYSKYLSACAKDDEMGVMVEVSNTYRTLMATFLLLPLSLVIEAVADRMEIGITARYVALAVLFLALFAFSFRKQASYVRERVDYYDNQ